MKFKLILISFILFSNSSFGQLDSSLIKKISVAGFCLCKTTVPDLKSLSDDFREIEVEEMNMGKKCVGEDSRYINANGYFSPKYPGIIFQKDRDEDYISKIRLT